MKNIKPFPVFSQSEGRRRTAELWTARMPLKTFLSQKHFQISFLHGNFPRPDLKLQHTQLNVFRQVSIGKYVGRSDGGLQRDYRTVIGRFRALGGRSIVEEVCEQAVQLGEGEPHLPRLVFRNHRQAKYRHNFFRYNSDIFRHDITTQ